MVFCHQYLSVSSLLLQSISPNTFTPIMPMCLSSRSPSISNTFRHILPCVAPFYEGMHYHKTGVPWQMNSTLIMVFFLLKRLVFPYFTHFFGFYLSSIYNFCKTIVQVAKYGSLRPSAVVFCSQFRGGTDYSGF